MMSKIIFDYQETAIRKNVPEDVLSNIVDEAQKEFPLDEMMKELHIIRAINAYTDKAKKAAS